MTETAPALDVQPAASASATIPTISTTPEAGSTPVDVNSPSFSIPEQYAEKAWAGNVKSMDDVFSQFDGLQSLVGKKSIPGADATDEQLNEFYTQLRPETADKYELGLPEGIELEINQDEQNEYKQLFHDIGLTAKQADALYKGHVNLEMTKAGKLVEGQATPEEAEAAKDAEFDKLVTEKLGDKADAAIKTTMAHALAHSEETKNAIAALPPEQMAAIVDLVSGLDSKIPKNAEDTPPEGGDLTAAKTIDEKVHEANELRMSIKDPFAKDNVSKRARLKQLDEEIQKAHNK